MAAAAGFLRAGFFAALLTLVLDFADFLAGTFLTALAAFAAFAFAAGFLAALRVRAEVL
jgi:hypothetical protein